MLDLKLLESFLTYKTSTMPELPKEPLLGCGSFVRGRKRKKGDSIPFILSRRDYPMRLHGELSSIPIIYIPNPSST